jgi:hypothetical protein
MMWLLVHAKDNSDVNVYTVHQPPGPPLDRIDRAAALVFVRDGFSWGAALFSPFYFLVKGQWVALLAYIVTIVLISALLWSTGIDKQWFSIAVLALNVFIGFEASTLEKAWLSFRGWNEIGTVAGRNLPECERRFIDAWLSGEAAPSIESPPFGSSFDESARRVFGWRRFLGAGA